MENPSRNMGKPVVNFKPPKFTKRVQTWNLLFVDNFGRTKHIKWFKGLVIFFFIILSLAVMGDVFLYLLYRIDKTSYESKIQMLTNTIAQKDALIKALEADKEKLIVSHIIDGKKPEEIPVSVPKEIIEKPVQELNRESTEMMKMAALESPGDRPSETNPVTVTPQGQQVTQAPEQKPPIEPEPQKKTGATTSKRISADDLEVSYRRNSKTLRVQFNISNVDPKSEPIAGFIFVILKPDSQNPSEWVVIPSTQISNAKPSDFKKGQSFSINYFKTVYFEAENQKEPIPYKTSTVLIYDKNGELMFEKDFKVSIN